MARAKARAFFLLDQTFSAVALYFKSAIWWRNQTFSVVNEHAGGSPKPPKVSFLHPLNKPSIKKFIEIWKQKLV